MSKAQDFRFVKTETSFTFRPDIDRACGHTTDHPAFLPTRGLIHIMGDKAKVTVSSPHSGRHWPLSQSYNLYRSHYPPAPQWLRTLLRQVGYGGLIE